jgi:hypothetical protein
MDGFILTDNAGNKIERLAQESDRIKIHLTPPLSWLGDEADGFYWRSKVLI